MSIMRTVMLLLVLLSASEGDSISVEGRTGQDVTLPCTYDIKYHGPEFACWGRGQIPSRDCNNQLIFTDGSKVLTRASSRYQLLGRLDEGDVSLTILNLTEGDAGLYGCRVEIPGWFNDQISHIDLTVTDYRSKTVTEEPTITTMVGHTGSDVITTEVMMTQATTWITPVQQVNHQEIFTGNTLRLSFIIFIIITALLLTAAHRV